MNKTSIKILISSFIVGITILSVALFTNQTSDITLNESQIAAVQLAQETGENTEVESSSGNNPNPAEIPSDSAAQTSPKDYQPISGLNSEEIRKAGGGGGNFVGLLRMIFNWAIAIIIALATLATVFGAIQYMTTDAVGNKEEGKKRMQAAIGGLILALMSWLILYSINQNILSNNFLLRLGQLETQNNSSSESTNVTTPTKTEYEKNNDQIDQLRQEADTIQNTIEFTKEIKDTCFDADGNFIEPPTDPNCTEGIKSAGIDRINTKIKNDLKKEIALRQEAVELEKRNEKINGSPEEIKESIKSLEERLNELNDFIEEANKNTSNPPIDSSNSNFQSNSNGSDYISIEDLIDLNQQQNNLDSEKIINTPELSIDDLNALAFQDQAFENIFVKNETANLVDMSEDLKSMLLITRDYCCGGKTTINEVETYKSSFNVSDIDVGDNSFLIEESITDGLGAKHWTTLHRNITSNLYPNQNLLDITKYLDCRNTRNRFISWTCRKPEDFRNINGRYYDLTKKGVSTGDVLKGETYLGEDKGLDFEAFYDGNKWNLKI